MLRLKLILQRKNLRQSAIARAAGISEATMAQLLNHGRWPISIPRESLEKKFADFLNKEGVTTEVIAAAYQDVTAEEVTRLYLDAVATKPTISGRPKPQKFEAPETEEDTPVMLIRKQNLTPAAKRQFGIIGDLFGDVRSSEEVYMSPGIRYVRESMYSVARDGGFMAVVGESGSGKSTLRYDLHERVARESAQVCVIEPYIIGMEDNDMKGKTLRASHIAEAIMSALAPHEKVSKSPEVRFKQIHEALRESTRAGCNNVLLIEEAHSIPIPVLKHLKRFHELKDGFRSLLSIILIGQPELAQKLNERDPAVREVVQRCELVTLLPLDEELKPYLQARFKHRGLDLTNVMDDTAIEAVRTKLSGPTQRPGQRTFSLLYPLAVGNVVTAALNAAAAYGIPKVTADLVKEV